MKQAISLDNILEVLNEVDPEREPTGCWDFGQFYGFTFHKEDEPAGTTLLAVTKHGGEIFDYNIIDDWDLFERAEEVSLSSELKHHGIKGQKWGVIRTPEQLGRRASNSEFKYTRKENNVGKDAKSLVYSAISYIPVVGPVVAMYSIARTVRSMSCTLDSTNYDVKDPSDITSVDTIKKKTTVTTPEEDMVETNPRKGKRGGVNNCSMLCGYGT